MLREVSGRARAIRLLVRVRAADDRVSLDAPLVEGVRSVPLVGDLFVVRQILVYHQRFINHLLVAGFLGMRVVGLQHPSREWLLLNRAVARDVQSRELILEVGLRL